MFMIRILTIVSFLFATTAFAHGNLKFVNGRWYDGTRFVEKTMYSVDNVFADTFDGEARVIDLGGRFVVPPYADAHNHAFADGANVPEQLRRYLGAGIFYVKNPNNSGPLTVPARAQVNKPETVDVLYANGGLTRTGGHPSQIYARLGPRFVDAFFTIDSPADLEAKWDRIRKGKPDFIKIYLEHSEDEAKRRGLAPALVPLIVQRAHRDGLTVSAHVTSSGDFHIAADAGVDEITHLPLAPITPADAELAAKKKLTVVTTVLSHRPGEGFTGHAANLALLKRHGVNVVLGVDGDPLVLQELHAVALLGVYSMPELLRMLVEATPRAIFPRRRIGRLATGYEASLLALDGNPLEDPAALRRIAIRVKQGHIIELPPEDPKVVEERDRNRRGYELLNHGRIDDAIAVFKENADKFPDSANAWDSLAEAYMKAGQKELAIANYKKALELNRHNENAKEMLRKLGGQ
jgi:imidazolonepropionase-like amidohydrolase